MYSVLKSARPSISLIKRHIIFRKMSAKKQLPKVTIFSEYPGIHDHIHKLDATIPLHSITVTDKYDPEISDAAMQRLKESEIVITDPNLLPHYYKNLTKNTKLVQSTWAGQDSFLKKINPSDPLPSFTLVKFGRALEAPLAEFVIGRLLAHERQMYDRYEAQVAGIWRTKGTYRLLSELTIGILGVGDIGCEIAKKCKAFGMTVWGLVRRNLAVEQRSNHVDHYCLASDLPVLLSNCDVICNVLPSTSETIGFLSGDVLAGAKEKKPIFINIGRGDVMTEDSIIKAIKEKWISHAILDVFPVEPLPKESLLWNMKEITISPHEAGLSFGKDVAACFIESYWRYVNGEDLKYIVNIEAGY
ncbi:glyoxylate/hydroxypyruvate reductase A-like [Antedon mediterranea]|uniref:glyoxylate/hydroxypyruvate reductase A-like n=1 Tax=Antedon mediterranea TaxID=105859 RepID=UPI003AF4702A